MWLNEIIPGAMPGLEPKGWEVLAIILTSHPEAAGLRNGGGGAYKPPVMKTPGAWSSSSLFSHGSYRLGFSS